MTDRFSTLPREVLVKILSHLGTPQEVVKCSYLSHDLRQATNEELLWHELAQIKYGTRVAEATLDLYEGSWKAMLMDDNKQGALPTKTMFKPCLWRLNDDDDRQRMLFGEQGRFYCCIITALQWDRVNGWLRVYIDARGESDLRQPHHTSIRTAGYDGELYTTHPRTWKPILQQQGHYKGYLDFDQRLFQHGDRYDFCYANHNHDRGDYESVPILRSSLEKMNFDHYTLNETLFENETQEDELARWNKVLPEGFLEKRPEWWT